jgi:hypothetical protein
MVFRFIIYIPTNTPFNAELYITFYVCPSSVQETQFSQTPGIPDSKCTFLWLSLSVKPPLTEAM